MNATPYADAGAAYQRNGWSPVPLPPAAKSPPPTGWTGHAAPMASGADVHDWAANGHARGNVGLRTPQTVLGLDVDAYDGKPGLATMLAAVERLGNLPPTVRSSSRADDPVSGIRFYTVPAGRCWADVLGPGVEVIHHGHRYAVAAPSVHPNGGVYRWYETAGAPMQLPPAVADLPELPPPWVADLDRGAVADRAGKADVTGQDVRDFLDAMPAGEPCAYVARLVEEAAEALSVAVSRHDAARGSVGRLVRAGEQGHRGAAAGLDTVQSLFYASLAGGSPRTADRGEWARLVTGAVALAVKTPTPVLDKGCCRPQPAVLESDDGEPLEDNDGEPLEDDEATERALIAAAAFAREVEVEAYRIRVREAGRDKVAAEVAASQEVPPFDAGLLVDVLARPAEPPHRVEGLIPSDAGTLIVAQRKTGKTTLQLNLARSLILGGDFLGRFAVRPVTGRIGFLNFEVGAAQLARWAHEAAVAVDRLYLVNLRGRRNPFTTDTDRELLAAQLVEHDVETLMVDPFGRAFVGKSQNDPGEVGAWLADLDRFARGDAGVSDVILSAHAGWDGERTRGASALEDWADSIVTLVRDRDDDQLRYLRAEGRDVLVEEDRLDYDGATRTLTLAGAGSRKVAAKSRHLDELVPAVVAVVKASPGITGYKLGQVLREDGTPFQRGDETRALAQATERGQIRHEPGPRNAKRYYLVSTYPDLPRPTPDGVGLHLPPPPIYGGGGGGGGQTGDLPQTSTTPDDRQCPGCASTLDVEPDPACGCPDLHEGRIA